MFRVHPTRQKCNETAGRAMKMDEKIGISEPQVFAKFCFEHYCFVSIKDPCSLKVKARSAELANAL